MSGMIDDITFQKLQRWVKMGDYCANEQFDDVRDFDHIMTW